MSGTGISISGLPLIMTAQGPQPTPPATLNAALLAAALSVDPGYTANLPGLLIEDIASTDTGAMAIIDSLRVAYVNSITPLGCNAFILNLQGQMLGIQIGVQQNTSVYVVFTGPAGYPIAPGFTVSDGTYQYVTPDGGIIGSAGTSIPIFFVATLSGAWAVPPGTVTQTVTSVPSSITPFSFTNPNAGIPAVAAETETEYRADVQQANLAASQGMSRYLKTLLGQVPGVNKRLISAQAQSSGGWMILVGGGDPYLVANAIWESLFDVSSLKPSVISITAITKATNAAVTTNIAHGLLLGQSNVHIAGVAGMTQINGGPYTVASVVDDFNFTLGVDSTVFGAYTSGGTVTPNARNVTASIFDVPDTYVIPIVVPLQQTVTMTVTWNTTSPFFVSAANIAQAAAPALAAYVNSIYVGSPLNLLIMNDVFQAAVAKILDPSLVTRLQYSVALNGHVISPIAGETIIQGDTQSYLFADPTGAGINVVQG